MLHLFRQERGAVGFGDLEGAANLMQKLATTHERSGAAPAIDTILERQVRIADRLHQFLADDPQRIGRLDCGVDIRPFLNA